MTVPQFARLRHDDLRGCWVMTCDLCGLRETWHKYWNGQRALADHRAMHEASEEDETPGHEPLAQPPRPGV